MSTDWDGRTAAAYLDEPDDWHGDDHTHEAQPMPEPQPMRRLVLVGSAKWAHPLIVQAVLLGWWTDHGQPPVLLITGMGSAGAELEAREYGSRLGWTVMSQTDAQLVRDSETADAAFGFIRDTSDVSSLANAIGARRPIRIFRDELVEPTGTWLSR